MASFSDVLKIINRQALQTLRDKAVKWFSGKVDALGYNRAPRGDYDDGNNILKSSSNKGHGNLILFAYDPKWKDTLPVYDKLPLVIPIGPAKGGFLGLNLHYIRDPEARVAMLYNLTGMDKDLIPPRFRFNISYDQIRRDPRLKDCIKHYLRGHVRSRFIRIPVDEWDNVVPLEIAQWVYKVKR